MKPRKQIRRLYHQFGPLIGHRMSPLVIALRLQHHGLIEIDGHYYHETDKMKSIQEPIFEEYIKNILLNNLDTELL